MVLWYVSDKKVFFHKIKDAVAALTLNHALSVRLVRGVQSGFFEIKAVTG